MNSVSVERRFAAILAADVVKYSLHMADNEERTLERFGDRRAVFAELVARRRGRMFGEAGDSLLAEFASPVEAVRAAVEVQQALAKKDLEQPALKPFQFRIGINLGDVMVDGENLYGEGVNLAARIEGLAEPGGVAISAHVHTHIHNKVDYGFEDQGAHQVKNAAEPVHIFKLLFSKPGEPAPIPNQAAARGGEKTAARSLKKTAPRLRRPLSKRPVRERDAGLEAVMKAALDDIKRRPGIGHGDERLPWFLFLGGSDSGIGDLLETAVKGSPPSTPPEQPNPAEIFPWNWWTFETLIAIETGQTFVEGPSEQDRLDAWSAALDLLEAARPSQPLSGIVICMPQKAVLDEGARKHQTEALHRLLEHAMTALKAPVPVYLLITRMDDIAGFTAFKAALPPGFEQQAIGHVVEDPQGFARDREKRTAALQPILDRLSSLRLGMLRAAGDALGRQGLFDFFHGFSVLAGGTSAIIDRLMSSSEHRPDIRLRGIFWLANGVEPAFYQDLFARFLPGDHSLAPLWSSSKPERLPRLSQKTQLGQETRSDDDALEIRPVRR
ncbi:MAG: type VI secretion protein IcmF/TssM N-terminal domain-containing protein [Geminicoccaceae bacterium]